MTCKLWIECTVVLKKAIAETSTKMVLFFILPLCNNETMGLKIYLVIALYILSVNGWFFESFTMRNNQVDLLY